VMMSDARSQRHATLVSVGVSLLIIVSATLHGQGRAGQPRGPDPSPRAAAPLDFTGYWVSVVTEDWRYRMVMPL
jgi:hypothetical protein